MVAHQLAALVHALDGVHERGGLGQTVAFTADHHLRARHGGHVTVAGGVNDAPGAHKGKSVLRHNEYAADDAALHKRVHHGGLQPQGYTLLLHQVDEQPLGLLAVNARGGVRAFQQRRQLIPDGARGHAAHDGGHVAQCQAAAHHAVALQQHHAPAEPGGGDGRGNARRPCAADDNIPLAVKGNLLAILHDAPPCARGARHRPGAPAVTFIYRF